MGGNEEFPLSHMLTDFNSIYRSILVENEYLKNKKEYLKKLCNEYISVTKDITYFEALQKEKIGREKLINDSIGSGRNTHLLLKEHKNSLLKELEMEQNRTAEQKNKHGSIISKYETTWEHYKEIYSKLPFSRERTKLQLEFKLKHIQLMKFKVEITEIKQKCLCLEQVREQRKRLEIVKLAEAYKDREAFSKKNAALIQEIRKLRDEIEIKKTEKQRLVNVRAKYKNEKHARQDTLSTSFRKTVMDIPCLSIPQLQLPPWYSPPRKIPCLEKRSKNNTSLAVGTDASPVGQIVVDVLTRDVGNILNATGGFQVRGKNSGEVTIPALPSSMVATQDFLAAEATEKSRQEVPETVATEDDGYETQPLPAAGAMDQPQPDSGQSHLTPDDSMDQAPALTSAEDQQSSTREETTPVSSTQQATAPVKTPEVVDVRAAGRCDTLESAVQKIDAGHMAGSHGDYRESPVGIVDQPTSDHGVLTSQTYTMKKTVQSDLTRSQVQQVTNTEDDGTDMNADVPRYLSPITDENVAGLDHTSEGDQCQDDCHFTASSEYGCCVLSPQGDFLMTSPDETLASKSPPFVISPTFHTTNTGLFGGPSSQQSNTGFTFNFGAPNTGSGVAERSKPNEGFQFSFDKKTSSRSFFQLF